MAVYTTIDDPSAFFQTTLYTGNGSTTHAITNGGNSDLQPDMVWIKDRGAANWHSITDVVRGHSKALFPNDTAAEDTSNAYVKAFNSDGFTLGSAGSDVNANTNTYVSWQWKAGTSFTNDASSTGIGSIDSAGSVNTDAGFSIMTYTGTGSNATFAHGLGAVPKMAIFKDRSSTGYWMTYHQAVGNGANLVLNETNALSAASVWWNSTSPTSSVFSIGTSNNINVSGRNYVGYLFADVKGYSKFGVYTGNGNDNGPFVYTGFKPAWIMIKRVAGSTGSWLMVDSKRDPFNSGVSANELGANVANAANDLSGDFKIDILSNGFKLRDDVGDCNASAQYVYLAFAENPFVTSTGVPATAR